MSDSSPSSSDPGSTGSGGSGDSGWGGPPSGASDPGQQSSWEGQQQSWQGQQDTPPTHQPYGQPSDPYTSPYTQPYGYPQGQQPGYGQQPPYGAPQQQAWPYAGPVRPTDSGATTAMIIGIVALATGFTCGIGFLASPVALFMGLSARRRIDASQGRLDGRGQATAGFWLGLAGTVLLVLSILLIALFVIVGMNGFFDTTEPYQYEDLGALG